MNICRVIHFWLTALFSILRLKSVKSNHIECLSLIPMDSVDLGEGSSRIIVCTDYCNSWNKVVSDGCI